MSGRRLIGEPSTPPTPPRPCTLPHHRPGMKVAWRQWDTDRGAMKHLEGTVISHSSRTLQIVTVAGETVKTSCGHVVACGAT